MQIIDTRISGFKIRKAILGDEEDILYFIKELAKYENELDFVTADKDIIRESIFIKKAAEVIFGVYNQEKIGFAVFNNSFSTFLGKPGINLVDLFIKPDMRNQGFGKEMLVYLAALTQERKCGRLEWWVHDWNDDAKRFYKRIGSKEIDNIRIYRMSGIELSEFIKW